MPFVDTNSHLTTKPSIFGMNCHSNSESYDRHHFFGLSLGWLEFVIYGVRFFQQERVHWLDLLLWSDVAVNPVLQMTNNQPTEQQRKYRAYPDFFVVGLLGIGKSGERQIRMS